MGTNIGIKYEAVGRPGGGQPSVYCLMGKDFLDAVGGSEMRALFEHQSLVVNVNDDFVVVVETTGDREDKITAAIDMAIEKGYTINVDASAIKAPEAGLDDVLPSFENTLKMLSAIRERMAAPELTVENDEISPS